MMQMRGDSRARISLLLLETYGLTPCGFRGAFFFPPASRRTAHAADVPGREARRTMCSGVRRFAGRHAARGPLVRKAGVVPRSGRRKRDGGRLAAVPLHLHPGAIVQNMCCPPLIAMFAPVTNAASSLDR